MNTQEQYDKQLKYFGDEFRNYTEYKLSSWQKSYIDKIKKYLVGKNYKGKVLLDVATGSGYVAVEMAKMGLKVIATDLTPESVENLKLYKKKLKLKNLIVKQSLAEKMKISNNSVDFLVANAILEHIPDEKLAIEEWKRVVKPNGKLFITTPLRFRYIFPFLWIPNILHDKRIGHLRRYNLEDFKKKFKLPILKVFYSGHLIKIIGIIIQIVTKSDKYGEYYEKADAKRENKPYGANNISVILKNSKK